jgi:hypothetical protein
MYSCAGSHQILSLAGTFAVFADGCQRFDSVGEWPNGVPESRQIGMG